MKTLIAFALSLGLAAGAAAGDNYFGRTVSDFRIKKAQVSKPKASFMVKALLDPDFSEGTEGLVGLDLDLEAGTLKLDFRAFRSKELDNTVVEMNLADWGVDADFEPGENQLEVSRTINLADITAVELFKAETWHRKDTGRIFINPVGGKAYYCRLVIKDAKPFTIRTKTIRQVWRLGVAFSSLAGLDMSGHRANQPFGLKVNGEAMVLEIHAKCRVQGLELFTVIRGIDGGKVLPGDDVARMLGDLGPGKHDLKIDTPKGRKNQKKSVDLTL